MTHPHLQKRHFVKLGITTGCLASSMMCLLHPGLEAQAAVISMATNVIWVWS